MRRIYESSALDRDDSDPFSPTEDDADRPQAIRWIDSTSWSRRLIPHWLRRRAISIDVSTPREEYSTDGSIPFTVTMKNALPIPITVSTRSPLPWRWDVDGIDEASHVSLRDPPEQRGGFTFDRGERKRFTRRWQCMFQTTESEWEPAGPGEYTIGAGLNVEAPEDHDLYDRTTVRIVSD
jgi:hypothetical protein